MEYGIFKGEHTLEAKQFQVWNSISRNSMDYSVEMMVAEKKYSDKPLWCSLYTLVMFLIMPLLLRLLVLLIYANKGCIEFSSGLPTLIFQGIRHMIPPPPPAWRLQELDLRPFASKGYSRCYNWVTAVPHATQHIVDSDSHGGEEEAEWELLPRSLLNCGSTRNVNFRDLSSTSQPSTVPTL